MGVAASEFCQAGCWLFGWQSGLFFFLDFFVAVWSSFFGQRAKEQTRREEVFLSDLVNWWLSSRLARSSGK